MKQSELLRICCCSAILSLATRAWAEPAELSIDKRRSRIEVAVQATAHAFTATLTDYQAEVRVEDDGRVTAAEFAFRFADLTTGNQMRDRAMQAWQQTGRYPDGRFTLSSLKRMENDRFLARGELSLHGVERAIEFPVTILVDHALYAFDGVVKLDTRDYGLPGIHKLGVLHVDPEVRVDFHLQAGARRGTVPFSPMEGSRTSMRHER